MDRGAWWATVHGVAKELVTTEPPSMHMRFWVLLICCVCFCPELLSRVSLFCNLVDCSPLDSSVHGIFPRQEYRSGLPFPSPGDLSDPGTESESPASPALTGGFFITVPPGKSIYKLVLYGNTWYMCKFWNCEISASASLSYMLLICLYLWMVYPDWVGVPGEREPERLISLLWHERSVLAQSHFVM